MIDLGAARREASGSSCHCPDVQHRKGHNARECSRGEFPEPPTSENPQYAHWQQYVGVEHRYVVPVTSFAEPSPTRMIRTPRQAGFQRNFWFALNGDRPLFFFAGLWTRWHGVRKVKEGPGDHEVYGFMTTKPNALIAPIHEKAMPVTLTTQEETETWLAAPWSEAKRLQRTAPDDALVIVEKPATQVKVPTTPVQGTLF